jgi:hypothetical protein
MKRILRAFKPPGESMGRTRSRRPSIQDAGEALSLIASAANILVPNRKAVADYLAGHSLLAKHLSAICEVTRNAFGRDVELSLELYADPETGDRYLTLYVRMRKYGPQFIDALEAVSGEFEDKLASVPGYFLLTSDFRQPGGTHGV